MQGAQSNVTGIRGPNPDTRHVISGGLPLGWTVSYDIKQKIWNDEFVEFCDLLNDNSKIKKTVTIDCKSGTTIDAQKRKREITCIRDWDKAFATFLNIYIQKPENLKHLYHLVTYGQEIKSMAELGLDFLKYDENFRKERASQVEENYEPWGWNIFRQEVYNHLQSQAILQKLNLPPKKWYPDVSFSSSFHNFESQKNNISGIPLGYCFDFHTLGKNCDKSNCTFRHVCPCGRGPHTLYACRTGGKSTIKRGGFGYKGRGRGRGANPPKEQ